MTDSIQRIPRPRELTIGVAVLAAVYLYGFGAKIVGGLFAADPSQLIAWGVPSLVVAPLLIAGVWFGLTFVRIVSVVLFIGQLSALAMAFKVGATGFGVTGFLLLAAKAAGLVLVFLPASNAWFRARKQALKRNPLYPIWMAIGIVFGIPLVVVLLLAQVGPLGTGGGLGTVLLIAVAYLFFIPAVIFGRPHFAFGIFAGPNDVTGWILMIAFYAFIAAILAAGLWLLRRRAVPVAAGAEAAPAVRANRWTGGFIGAVLLGLLVVMIVPQIRDRQALDEELQAKVAYEQSKLDAKLTDYPQLEGDFTIFDEGGHYGVKSSGRWKIAKGALEVVADSTQIWHRYPRCADCPRLKSWQFTLRSVDRARGPWLGAVEKRSGFQPMPATAGPDGKVVVTGHRMFLPLAENDTVIVLRGDRRAEGQVVKHLPPGILADFWPGIEMEFGGGSSFPVSATDPFVFADALAAKGLAPARCAAPTSIADAVQRACHAELAAMLRDPARRSEIEKGDKQLRTFSRDSTPLYVALWKKDARAAELLLENGADPNRKDIAGYTLLMTAANHDAAGVVAALARHGVNVNEQYKGEGQDAGKTALILAAVNGSTETVRALLAAGADKSIKTRNGYNAYEHAERFGHTETAALLK